MNNNYLIILLLAAFIVIVLILVIFIILNSNKHNSQIDHNILEIRNSLNHDLLDFSNNMNDDINSLSERLNSNLIQSHKSTNDIFNEISQRIVKIDEAQKGIDNLSKEVTSLQSILSDKKSRGTFGEIELYSLLENTYGVNNSRFAKQYHLPNGSIADAVIFGGESLGLICIDSKFPLENYRRIYDDNLSQIEKDNARKLFRNDVKKHIDDIKNKYIIDGLTANMAYMFIPAEAIFAEIYGNYDEIIEKSYQDKVYLVSPTTLMAYITAIKSIYLGQTKDIKAKEIGQLLSELSVEFKRLNDRQNQLYSDYQKLEKDFELLNTSSNKIIKKFDKINAGEIDD